MKVIFLDFDGVLNSQASVLLSVRRHIANPYEETPINEDLCHVCCSNFQFVLDSLPDVKVVISSSWRTFFTLEQLKDILTRYNIDATRVIDVTPKLSFMSPIERGHEISAWLEGKEVEAYAIVDDNSDMTIHMDRLVQTNYDHGLTVDKALQLIKKIDPKYDIKKNYMKPYYKEFDTLKSKIYNIKED